MIRRVIARRLPLWFGTLTVLLVSGCFGPDDLPVALFALDPESGDSPLVVRS